MDLVVWNRSSVPVSWSSGTCRVAVNIRNNIGHIDEDTFRPSLVAHVGALIIRGCVTDHTGYLGGDATVGGKGVFSVGVHGVGNGVAK